MALQPVRHRESPRARALFKVASLVVLVNLILTSGFALVAHQNHPDVALGLTILFGFGLCAILSGWIRSDAKHAWLHARDAGYLSSMHIHRGRTVWIRQDCPQRWLVVLHIEFAGGMAASPTPNPAQRPASHCNGDVEAGSGRAL